MAAFFSLRSPAFLCVLRGNSMYISMLRLVGYTRLMLNNIQHFEYSPASPYQVILGSNGSGKSSVLAELTPLPGNPSDYTKEGSKEIWIDHNGSSYILISDFKTGKHRFIKDNEHLNEGGTITVQKELVRREFGVWADLNDVLMDRVDFVDMGPSKRRDWFTAMSKCDYSYAMQLFDRVKSRARDTQGALKKGRERLAAETQNLSALGEIAGIQEQCQKWKDELNALLLSRNPHAKEVAPARRELDRLLREIAQAGPLLLDSLPDTAGDYQTVEDLKETIAMATQEVTSTQALLEHRVSEHQELEEILSAMGGEVVDVQALTAKHDAYQTDANGWRARLRFFQHIDDASAVIVDAGSAVPALDEMFANIPDNSTRLFTRERIAQTKEHYDRDRLASDKLSRRIGEIDQRLAHMRHAKTETCPQCQYVWIPGHSEDEQAALTATHADLTRQYDALVLQVRASGEYIEQAEDYTAKYRQIRQVIQSYPRLKALWDEMAQRDCIGSFPKSHIPFLYDFLEDAKAHAQIQRLEADCRHLADLLERDKLQRGESSARFDERLAKVKQSIEDTTARLVTLNLELRATKSLHDRTRKWQGQYVSLEAYGQQLPHAYNDCVEAIRAEQIDRVISSHQSTLALSEQKLVKHNTLRGVVDVLEHDEAILTKELEAFKVLIKELSPSEGLIADQLNGFIACAVAQMNAIIEQVWEYELKIYPCANKDGELDYKFPISAQGYQRDDIAYGSEAQKDMFNFAFKMTLMLYLGHKEYPLYLDELGASFDDQHRINVMNFVKRLVDTGQHRQVFLISHYASSHGAFNNADVMVMDGRNIAVPAGHNQHVVMR